MGEFTLSGFVAENTEGHVALVARLRRDHELAIQRLAQRLYTAACASDDSVHDAIYSGFFDIPKPTLAKLFREGDTAELGRLIDAAADKVLHESAKEEAKRERAK